MSIQILLMNKAGQGYIWDTIDEVQFLSPPYQTPDVVSVNADLLLFKPPKGFDRMPDTTPGFKTIQEAAGYLSLHSSVPRVDEASVMFAKSMVVRFSSSWIQVCLDHIRNVYWTDYDGPKNRALTALKLLKQSTKLEDGDLKKSIEKLLSELEEKPQRVYSTKAIFEHKNENIITVKDQPIPPKYSFNNPFKQ